MKRRQIGLALSVMVLFGLLLAACAAPVAAPAAAPATGDTATEAAPAEAAPAEAVAGDKVTYNSYQSDPAPRAWIEGTVGAWNEANPDQPVDMSIINHEDFKQALRAMLTASPAPDVMDWFAGNRARFFIDRGLIADFSDVWEQEGWDDVYAPGFAALASYNDGKYFLPSSYYWWAIYYRPSLFEQAGIAAAPETFDELLQACDALNAAGITPITIGARFKWPAAAWFDYLNMRTNGPEFHIDLMDLEIPYNDPRVKAAFENWQKLIDANCFIDDPAAYDWQEAVDPMVQGEAAMYLMGGFIVDSYPDEAEADLDFFRFPVINPDVPIGEDAPTDGYFMAANAGNLPGRQGVPGLSRLQGSAAVAPGQPGPPAVPHRCGYLQHQRADPEGHSVDPGRRLHRPILRPRHHAANGGGGHGRDDALLGRPEPARPDPGRTGAGAPAHPG
jgi:ABC-type glycerol-3-phosphate transport system substrate-binding protein